jgi:tetratricopeptide (TPR) repeat protein
VRSPNRQEPSHRDFTSSYTHCLGKGICPAETTDRRRRQLDLPGDCGDLVGMGAQPRPPAEPPPPVASAPKPRTIWLAAGLLTIAVALAYHNTFAVPFHFDDKAAVLENPSIRQLWPLSAVLAPPPEASGAAGRPLINLSLALNHAISGEAVWSYHALNLLVHLLAGLTLFGIVRRTLLTSPCRSLLAGDVGESPASRLLQQNSLAVSFAVAALWLVHPLQTESVTCVIQRSELIVGLFYLLTLSGFVRSTASPQPGRWLVLSVAVCALGMAAKELMVTAPVLVLLYDRAFVAGSFGRALRERRVYYAALAATWFVLAWLLLRGGGSRGVAAGFGLGVSPWDYLLTQCRALAIYLQLAVWPHPLVLDYGTAVVRDPLAVLPQGLLLLALLAGTVWACWRRPAAGFAGAAFFLILAPSSSIVPLVTQTIAEHRMYLPLAALLALLVPAAYARLGRGALVAALLAAPVLATVTVRRNHDYRSELALWTDTVAKAPANPRARVNLSEVLILGGDPAAALGHAAEAVRLRPDYADAQMNLGIALAQTGRPAEALPHAREAVRLQPDSLRAQSNLGVVLAKLGELPEAVTHLEKALQLSPAPAEAVILHGNLGYILRELGRLPEAEAQLEALLRLQPDHAAARRALDDVRAARRY